MSNNRKSPGSIHVTKKTISSTATLYSADNKQEDECEENKTSLSEDRASVPYKVKHKKRYVFTEGAKKVLVRGCTGVLLICIAIPMIVIMIGNAQKTTQDQSAATNDDAQRISLIGETRDGRQLTDDLHVFDRFLIKDAQTEDTSDKVYDSYITIEDQRALDTAASNGN